MAAKNNVAFANIRAEMGRRQVTITEIARMTGMCKDTVSRKLSMQAPISLAEAYWIRDCCFPECSVSYLFSEAIKRK